MCAAQWPVVAAATTATTAATAAERVLLKACRATVVK
jgi:hypothetical protein